MLLTSIALCALLSPTLDTPPTPPKPAVAEGHGKLPWFTGTFDEVLAKAKAGNQLVFIDFWTDWCVWCKRLDAGAFADDSVVESMKDVICYSVNAESETGAPLAAKFKVKGYPALIVLSPDGSVRDTIGGFLTPDQFKTEMQRMRADKGTVSDLRRQVAEEPKNVDRVYALMQKLASLGDDEGALEQRNAIPKLDPEGKSLAMHEFAFEKVMEDLNKDWNEKQTLDVSKVMTFLEKETYPPVLFKGWYSVYKMHGYLAQEANQKGEAEEAKKQEGLSFQALRNIWKYAGKDERTNIGPQVALDFFQRRAAITADEKVFALQVAKDTHELAPDNAAAVAGLACCLYMNGSKDEAIAKIQRAIEMDPTNKNWPARLADFQAGS
jgi:thiol-disulfide isomerase/thioredoxin